ncbi:MAG: zf-HC2 domain-containing protein [Acidobacteriia bacterium]|nr:zf-HC2 domain-containing protein [Terriglobia bacterium]
MTCREARLLVSTYQDGELDPVQAVAVESHARDCAACAALLEGHIRLSAAVAAAPYYPASAALRQRLAHRPAPLWRRPAPWLALAASVAVALLAVVKLAPAPIESEIVQAHLRSMRAQRLVDVPASGPHAVRPWLAGKLDFALNVADISGRGFVLVGGRVDSLNGRTVAALVYRRGTHVVNVFVWPAANQPDQPPASAASDGFNIVNWRSDGMTWWAVSDLDRSELERLPLCPCFLPPHDALRG